MRIADTITVKEDKTEVELNVQSILYVVVKGNTAYIHISGREPLQTRITLLELEERLGDCFIKIKRGCLVSVLAIHSITETVNLGNGEMLEYAQRNRQELRKSFREKQREIIRNFADENRPMTEEEYHDYYRVFDRLPIAFTDIEMIFDEKCRAVDWVFRYANSALAELEKQPLDRLLGAHFSAVFPNMDSKWLRTYEWATLFGETLKIVDYSPEIDTNLEILCFPTFKGHCGCILFDVEKLNFFRKTDDTEKAIAAFVGRLLG